MIEFKKCPRGHVYDSELNECPYCNGRTIDDDLENLTPDEVELPPDEAMCYDMGPGDFRSDFDYEEEDEDKDVKLPPPLPPPCYAPQPPKFKRRRG